MTVQAPDIEHPPVLPLPPEPAHPLRLAGLGACVTTQRQTRRLVRTLRHHRQHLEAAVLDDLVQRAILAEDWVENMDQAATRWWNQIEQLSRLQFEQFLHQCGLATQDDLRALVRRIDEVNLQVADLSETLEKTA